MAGARGRVEVEVKARIIDASDLRARLREHGAKRVSSESEEDAYFAHPARDFTRTDEALRVRTKAGRAEMTYKGPKLDATTKTRREITVPLEDGAHASELLTALGFLAVAVVRKRRETFEVGDVTVTLDDVDGVGLYAELELLVDEGDVGRARDQVLALARELGLNELERRSYLEMLLARGGAAHPK